MTYGALSGLSVVEVGSLVAAPFCGKLLADLGANVVKIEPPGVGDPARWRGPFPNDEPHPERSALFLYLNTSKRSVTLDLATDVTEDDNRILRELLAGADVFIEDTAPGTLERLGLAYADLSQANPGLVMTSITPFGQTGPHRDLWGHPLNCYHVGGHTAFHLSEAAERRPPAKAAGYLGEYDAGLTAAVGTLGALAGRRLSGRGRHVDISKQEAMMGVERVEIAIMANEPIADRKMPSVGGLMQAKDGYFIVTPLENHQWHGLVRAMGDPEWAKADWCQTERGRFEHAAEIRPRIDAWAAGLTRDEIYHRCQVEGTPVGPVRNTAEVSEWEQARARGFFVELDHPEAGVQRYPTAAYRLSQTPWCGRRAPLLGEHNAEVLQSPASVTAPKAATEKAPKPSQHPPDVAPLAGVRVVDFTWAWAGPHGTLLLAMLGAEVIKIESRTRLDHLHRPQPRQALRHAQPAHAGGPRDRAAAGRRERRRDPEHAPGRARPPGPRLRRPAPGEAGHRHAFGLRSGRHRPREVLRRLRSDLRLPERRCRPHRLPRPVADSVERLGGPARGHRLGPGRAGRVAPPPANRRGPAHRPVVDRGHVGHDRRRLPRVQRVRPRPRAKRQSRPHHGAPQLLPLRGRPGRTR
jgi:crotonobetainyl-CoA:carnitine CoA-transferase CaiB-like acyl-CoA transferase